MCRNDPMWDRSAGKDRLKANPALYRAELSCRIGKDLIEGKAQPPAGVTREEWIWYMLFSAIEDLAKGIAP